MLAAEYKRVSMHRRSAFCLPTLSRLFFCLALGALGCASAPPPPDSGAARVDEAASAQGDTRNDAQIGALMSAFHKLGWFEGSVLVAKSGKVVYRGAFGLANREWGVPATVDARYRIASITKPFTATVALKLVEQGKLRLDAKLTDYLPDYRKDTGDQVTIHHLLSHTSGIPDPWIPRGTGTFTRSSG